MAISPIYQMPAIAMRPGGQPNAVEIGEKKLPSLGQSDGPSQVQEIGQIEETQQANNFGDLLAGAVQETARLGHVSGDASRAFARGLNDDLHGTMISAKEAEISLKMVGSVRTKLLDAFHELWRISV